MKVKLQGGPMHGKTVDVPDFHKTLTLAWCNPQRFSWAATEPSDTITTSIEHLIYAMIFVPNPLKPFELIPATTPRGEVYFQHHKS